MHRAVTDITHHQDGYHFTCSDIVPVIKVAVKRGNVWAKCASRLSRWLTNKRLELGSSVYVLYLKRTLFLFIDWTASNLYILGRFIRSTSVCGATRIFVVRFCVGHAMDAAASSMANNCCEQLQATTGKRVHLVWARSEWMEPPAQTSHRLRLGYWLLQWI